MFASYSLAVIHSHTHFLLLYYTCTFTPILSPFHPWHFMSPPLPSFARFCDTRISSYTINFLQKLTVTQTRPFDPVRINVEFLERVLLNITIIVVSLRVIISKAAMLSALFFAHILARPTCYVPFFLHSPPPSRVSLFHAFFDPNAYTRLVQCRHSHPTPE